MTDRHKAVSSSVSSFDVEDGNVYDRDLLSTCEVKRWSDAESGRYGANEYLWAVSDEAMSQLRLRRGGGVKSRLLVVCL